jgi:hypothetical protein
MQEQTGIFVFSKISESKLRALSRGYFYHLNSRAGVLLQRRGIEKILLSARLIIYTIAGK